MKKISVLLIALIASAFAMQVNAAYTKSSTRSIRHEIYDNPKGFQQVGESLIYYDVSTERQFASSSEGGLFTHAPEGPGMQHAISFLGRIDDASGKAWYYPCTYGDDEWDDGCGAGFLAAMKVGTNDAVFMNALTGTTNNGVTMTARVEAAGDQAALITYTLTNNNNQAVTVSAGVYADIMIGLNDYAPLYSLKKDNEVYGLKMIEDPDDENSALFCALFGDGVTGVTAADDYWFGRFDHNYSAEQLVGNVYSDLIWDRPLLSDVYDTNYMEEGGDYDSGMGFCWKNKRIEAGESIELSYIISVGDYDMEEPMGDDRLEYQVEARNFEGWNDLSVEHPAHVWGYYEHPYGQEGYIEYQVDDENTWHRIPTALVSGEEFDLDFNMLFNESRDTDHVLALRFNDGLDNITPMTGLSWTDVRSIAITGLEDRVYNGLPQIYEVMIGEIEPFSLGGDGAYTLPGDYTYSIEGVFADNTIGINEVEFSILKGESELNVTIPEDCVYDANEHAATAELVTGDGQVVITYKNTETEEVSENAPVEPGTYEVFVEVINSTNYNDIDNASYGTFTIGLAGTVINVTIPEDCVYDANEHAATAELVVGDGDIVITYKNTETGDVSENAPVDPGTYEVFVEVINSVNYNDIDNTSYGTFTIGKLETILSVTIPEDCVYDGNEHAATAVLLAGDGDIVITYEKKDTREATEEAPVEPGTYEVFVEVINSTYYNDLPNTSYGTFTIDKAQTEIEFEIPEDCVYDGEEHAAEVEVVVGDGELTVIYKDTETGETSEVAPKEPGTYEVIVIVTETDHYYGIEETVIGEFTINAKHTGLNELTIGNDDNGEWYTIDGRRVTAPTKGVIYIHNGKKILVK